MYTFPRASDYFGTNFDDVVPKSHLPSPSPALPPPHLLIPDHQLNACTEFDYSSPVNMAHSTTHSSSNSCCSSYGSPSYGTSQSQRPSLMQRSISSHSLQKNISGVHCCFMSTNNDQFLDMETPVRRVCSTGDLHRVKMGQYGHRTGSPLASESSIIIEGMNRASRYSPEEKKERIERYRTKRTQRNFTKKIKYACRKTLADSRPRIRGRFARNEEIEKNPQVQWNHVTGEEDDEDDDNWINYLDSVSSANPFS